jgi:hypothetical protein
MIPSWLGLPSHTPRGSLQLSASDVERQWLLTGVDTAADLTSVSGHAGSLLLGLRIRDTTFVTAFQPLSRPGTAKRQS